MFKEKIKSLTKKQAYYRLQDLEVNKAYVIMNLEMKNNTFKEGKKSLVATLQISDTMNAFIYLPNRFTDGDGKLTEEYIVSTNNDILGKKETYYLVSKGFIAGTADVDIMDEDDRKASNIDLFRAVASRQRQLETLRDLPHLKRFKAE